MFDFSTPVYDVLFNSEQKKFSILSFEILSIETFSDMNSLSNYTLVEISANQECMKNLRKSTSIQIRAGYADKKNIAYILPLFTGEINKLTIEDSTISIHAQTAFQTMMKTVKNLNIRRCTTDRLINKLIESASRKLSRVTIEKSNLMLNGYLLNDSKSLFDYILELSILSGFEMVIYPDDYLVVKKPKSRTTKKIYPDESGFSVLQQNIHKSVVHDIPSSVVISIEENQKRVRIPTIQGLTFYEHGTKTETLIKSKPILRSEKANKQIATEQILKTYFMYGIHQRDIEKVLKNIRRNNMRYITHRVVTLGMPQIRAGDILYTSNELLGKVQSVRHIINADEGFISELNVDVESR